MNEYNKIIHGDCLIESDRIGSGTVDLILTDLPYGTVTNIGDSETISHGMKNKTEWDLAIEPKKIYEIANRILRKNGKMILFGQEPYTTKLINESIPNVPFSYRMMWEKDHFANSLIAKKAPVNYYEDILVFSKNYDMEGIHPLRIYFKNILKYIGLNKSSIIKQMGQQTDHCLRIESSQFAICTENIYNKFIKIYNIDKMQEFKSFAELKEIDDKFKNELSSTFNLWEGNKFKSNILKYKKDYEGLHPCQKPLLLLQDLVKTFSNENDLIVDLTCGSGSTLMACINTNRQYIGIEKDLNYYNISINRISGYIHVSI